MIRHRIVLIAAVGVRALIAFLGFLPCAGAEVIYTPVNISITGKGSIPLDLNDDGVIDFRIHETLQSFTCGLRGGVQVKATIGNNGVVVSHLKYASVLPVGTLINSKSVFYQPNTIIDEATCPGGSRSVSGYLGLEYPINGRTHYGWAQITVNISRYGIDTTLLGFAYESVAGRGIHTGQTSGSMPDSEGSSGLGIPEEQSFSPQNSGRQYRLVDMGTLGGPNSYLPLLPPYHDFVPAASLSASGTFAGYAETTETDPYAPFCFTDDCLVAHAFTWKNGVRTDLGALPNGTGSSAATWISKNGVVAGISENGQIDPLTGRPSVNAVLWKKGQIVNLGTLDGGYNSGATAVNNARQVVGFYTNTIPDPNSLLGTTTQSRAFLWQHGTMQDLGTLPGGTDAMALFINDRGQIVGQSYATNSIVPPPTGCVDSPLTLFGFIWENGHMADLGTLGGSCTFPYALNNRGEVVGQSNLTGDTVSHPFFWQSGRGMKDLGTLGGTYGYSEWLNDHGTVVGSATNAGDQSLLAFQWQNGRMTNLGTLQGDACSAADAINEEGLVVGGSGFDATPFFPACTGTVEHATLWDHGKVVDLNQFVPQGTDLTLVEAYFINDRGEIDGFGVRSDGNQHAFVLVPCGSKECQDLNAEAEASVKSNQVTTQQSRHGWDIKRSIRSGSSRHNNATGVLRYLSSHRLPYVETPTAPFNLTANALNTYQIKLHWQEAPGQNQTGFNVYRCRGCSNPRTHGERVASVGAGALSYTDGSKSHPLRESKTYTYQVTAFDGSGESGPSNTASATTPNLPPLT